MLAAFVPSILPSLTSMARVRRHRPRTLSESHPSGLALTIETVPNALKVAVYDSMIIWGVDTHS